MVPYGSASEQKPKRKLGPDGIAARERLLAMVRDGLTRQPFVQWTAADQSAVHTVCRQFELVGQLIEDRLFDPDFLFLRSWHHNIVRCWQACEPMVICRRGQLEEPDLAATSRDCTCWRAGARHRCARGWVMDRKRRAKAIAVTQPVHQAVRARPALADETRPHDA